MWVSSVNHQAHVFFSYSRPDADAGTIETKNVLCSRSRTRGFRGMIVIFRRWPLIWSSIPCELLELESIPCQSSFYFRPVSIRFFAFEAEIYRDHAHVFPDRRYAPMSSVSRLHYFAAYAEHPSQPVPSSRLVMWISPASCMTLSCALKAPSFLPQSQEQCLWHN